MSVNNEEIRDIIREIILIKKPEIEIYRYNNFALYCELDMFNHHILYIVRKYDDADFYWEYDCHLNFEDAITELLEIINYEEKGDK